MARRKASRKTARGNADAAKAVRDSAQKIWLAGLGALERARVDGPRAFESLVEQGRNMGARAVGAADEALKAMRQADYSGNHWGKLEQAFEERLTRSLGKLGVLTARDVEDLSRQVRDLSDSMRRFMTGAAGAAADGATPGTRKRKATGAAAKAARRRAAKAKTATGTARASPRVKKAARRAKPRKASRRPRATP